MWLFQEGERVSSDRLFRVRKTQPHSNDPDAQKTTPTDQIVQQEPIVSSTLQIGDLCIFLDTRTPKIWNFGTVIKFAYYKEKTKKSRQYVLSTFDLTTINHYMTRHGNYMTVNNAIQDFRLKNTSRQFLLNSMTQ